MNFPFSIKRKHLSSIKINDHPPDQVLPPPALYIHRRLTDLGIRVEIPHQEKENWIALYLPEYCRLIAVFINGDPVFAKINAKSYQNSLSITKTRILWIYPATLYADCQKVLKRIIPFGRIKGAGTVI